MEQKISDGGPFDQRIDPHVLTDVRASLVQSGEITRRIENDVPWYHLSAIPDDVVQQRLEQLQPIHARTLDGRFVLRVGQVLEIAIFRALRELYADNRGVQFCGGFRDLDKHSDATLYRKVEPDFINGRNVEGGLVDFVVTTPDGIQAAIEAKNIRQWVYPDRLEIEELLRKSLDLDAVPVLIARRIPFVTFYILSECGVLFHQTYNQLYPAADAELAALAKDKLLLGYHDIRVGNDPDVRLKRFITEHLVPLLPAAQERFEQFRDLVEGYVDGTYDYEAFTARVGRRVQGESEDWPEGRE